MTPRGRHDLVPWRMACSIAGPAEWWDAPGARVAADNRSGRAHRATRNLSLGFAIPWPVAARRVIRSFWPSSWAVIELAGLTTPRVLAREGRGTTATTHARPDAARVPPPPSAPRRKLEDERLACRWLARASALAHPRRGRRLRRRYRRMPAGDASLRAPSRVRRHADRAWRAGLPRLGRGRPHRRRERIDARRRRLRLRHRRPFGAPREPR